MTGDAANLILECKVDRTMGDMRSDLHDMRDDIQGISRRPSHMDEGQALINQRLDRIDSRVTRIGRRLDLVEG